MTVNVGERGANVVPYGYFLVALAAITLLVPTILRVPPDQATESAEFSPDAPPDDVETIVAVLHRGTTGTAGTGDGQGFEGVGPGGPPAAVEPPPPPPRACRFGYGDPPRQASSLYATKCAAPWAGDNGGETSFGVTRDAINVAVGSGADYEGPVDAKTGGSEPAAKRTLRVFQEWINTRFQFYGRQMRIHMVKVPLTNPTNGAAAARKAREEFQAFANVDRVVTNGGYVDESVRQKMVTWIAWYSSPFFQRHHPYAYSWYPTNTQATGLTGELVCGQLAGKPPEYNERLDPTFDYTKPRKFGVLLYTDESRADDRRDLMSSLGRCDVRPEVVELNLGDGSDQIATAVSRMRASGATTVIMATDWATTAATTRAATSNGYWPEWLIAGVGAHGTNSSGQLYDQEQWSHAFGIDPFEIPRPQGSQDHERAYKDIDPGGTPNDDIVFYPLLQIANGIQEAGPNLTPEAFWKGLQRVPYHPPSPKWSVGGGYGPGDYSYSDYYSLIWWDPLADAPDVSVPGAYRHLYGGQRFRSGELPADRIPFFKDGVTTTEETP